MDPSPSPDPVVLRPSYGVALGVVGLGVTSLALLPLWPGALWVAVVVSLFGLFLVLQTALLRLEFGGDALVVRRGGEELRRFPYDDWLGWRLFWPVLPVLFYFRERRSIHLLPVLFDATGLREQLQRRLPRLSANPSPAPANSQDTA